VIYAKRGKCTEKKSTATRKFQILSAGIACFALACLALQIFAENLGSSAWKATLVAVVCASCLPFCLARTWDKPEDEILCAKDVETTNHPVDVGGFSILGRVDYWLLLAALTITQGASLLVISNSAQILPAFTGGPASTTAFVGMTSVFSCYGRLLFGGLSDTLAASITRPWWIVAASAIVGISHLLLYTGGHRMLWVGAAGTSLGYGGTFGVQAAVVKELFGMKDIPLKLAFTSCAALFGSILFATLLAGELYDREARTLGTTPNCYQPSCFKTSFLVCAICSIFSVLLSAILAWRTLWIYKSKEPDSTNSDDKLYGSTL